jgi:2-octaprenyl-6-methoxyphenol hydroxylase
MKNKNIIYADIVICGGALAGITAALSLQRLNLKILIIDPISIIDLVNQDNRTTALAAGPTKFYKKHGLWDKIKTKAEPINKINVVDGNSNAKINFNIEELKKELNIRDVNSLGYVVENAHLIKCIDDRIKINNKNRKFNRIKAKVLSMTVDNSFVAIELDNNKTVSASLLIAADGRNSYVRNLSGIEEKKSKYEQWAFVCRVKHKESHKNLALEKFLPGGPLAVLPMIKKNDQNFSSVIWSDHKSITFDRYKSASGNSRKITYELERHVKDWIGKIQEISFYSTYPLELIYAKNFISERLVLVGDAAHGLHPIAGQGFNLAIRDIDLLSKLILRRLTLGLDIGSKKFLSEYQNLRRIDTDNMIIATHNLNQFFRITNPSVKLFRRFGISLVEKSPSLKRAFMMYAMGL